VADASRFRGFEPNEILVVCDDVNLPLGKIRIRAEGSDGGHNGLKSIIEQLGSDDFPRVRLGIGQPENPDKPLESYVLEKFTKDEQKILDDLIVSAADAVETVIRDGIEAAQQKFN
jgi:peptidyl-tRNA hydrolase, PTH1 family